MIGGVRIIESLDMVDLVEDWSRVRSPARARRRRRKHPQNIRMIALPKREAISIDGGRTMIMHPEMARQLRELIARQADAPLERTIVSDAPAAVTGMPALQSLAAVQLRPSPFHGPMFGLTDVC